jgi:hypothetical protein
MMKTSREIKKSVRKSWAKDGMAFKSAYYKHNEDLQLAAKEIGISMATAFSWRRDHLSPVFVNNKKDQDSKKGKYATHGAAVREIYLRTGNLKAAAEEIGVSEGTAYLWSRRYGWHQQFVAAQTGSSFLSRFSDKLKEHIDRAGEKDWSMDIAVIKGLSDLVLSWQGYEDRRAAEARKEIRELKILESTRRAELPAIFLDHLQFIFSQLGEGTPAHRALAEHVDKLTEAYKEHVAAQASN